MAIYGWTLIEGPGSFITLWDRKGRRMRVRPYGNAKLYLVEEIVVFKMLDCHRKAVDLEEASCGDVFHFSK